MLWLRVCLRIVAFLTLTLSLAPFQFVFSYIPGIRHLIPRFFHRTLMRIFGVHVRVSGTPPVPGTLLVSNHLSWFDIVTIGSLASVSFVAKKEVKTWPLFGQLAHLQRTVFVDRRPGRHTAATSNELAQRLAAGDCLVLFAEGTTTDGTRLLPFKSSLFAAVERAVHAPRKNRPEIGVTVQPMTIHYSEVHNLVMGRRQRGKYAWVGDEALLPHLIFMLKTPPLVIDIVFHAPLNGADVENRKTMARASQQEVLQGLDQIRGRRLAAQAKNG
jgi:1-acyl-sn-glycerol-3-phosphate acyltransferase